MTAGPALTWRSLSLSSNARELYILSGHRPLLGSKECEKKSRFPQLESFWDVDVPPQLVTQPRSSSCIHFIHVGRKRAPVAALEIRVLFSSDTVCWDVENVFVIMSLHSQ